MSIAGRIKLATFFGWTGVVYNEPARQISACLKKSAVARPQTNGTTSTTQDQIHVGLVDSPPLCLAELKCDEVNEEDGVLLPGGITDSQRLKYPPGMIHYLTTVSV